jgi:FkbM family methyltransferase
VERNSLKNVRLNRAALWQKNCPLCLGLPENADNNSGSYSVGAAHPGGRVQIESDGVRLDDYAAERSLHRVDVIKLDIEGAELAALRGMRELLERHRPVILMEINRVACARLGYEPAALEDLLIQQLNYRAWQIGSSASMSGTVASIAKMNQQNVLFHHADLSSDVTKGWSLKSVLRWARGARS